MKAIGAVNGVVWIMNWKSVLDRGVWGGVTSSVKSALKAALCVGALYVQTMSAPIHVVDVDSYFASGDAVVLRAYVQNVTLQ